MKYYFIFNEEGRPVAFTTERHPQQGGILLDPPGDIKDAMNWIYDGEWHRAPIPQSPVESVPTTEERIAELEAALELILSGVTE